MNILRGAICLNIRWSLCDDDVIEIFRDGCEEPERYSVKEFIAIHGEDALPERDKPQELGIEPYYEYWDAAFDLVNAWVKYQGKRKLYANYVGENTRHRVEQVITKSYGGDINKLVRHLRRLSILVNEALGDFYAQCRKYGIQPVDAMWLRMHLLEDKHYRSLRGKCQRRRDKNKPPTPLSELL